MLGRFDVQRVKIERFKTRLEELKPMYMYICNMYMYIFPVFRILSRLYVIFKVETAPVTAVIGKI